MLDFYKKFYNEHIVNKLISINVLIFILTLFLPDIFLSWFMMPVEISEFIKQPWSIISSMFMHNGLMHLLFNMLWLWSLGKMLLYHISEKDFIILYFYSGIISAISVLIYVLLVGGIGFALGASGAISGIIFAAIFIRPEEQVNLFGIFQVKMKWIAWGLIIMNIINMSGDNAGGSIAHLSGSLFGYIWIKRYYNRDILKDIINF